MMSSRTQAYAAADQFDGVVRHDFAPILAVLNQHFTTNREKKFDPKKH